MRLHAIILTDASRYSAPRLQRCNLFEAITSSLAQEIRTLTCNPRIYKVLSRRQNSCAALSLAQLVDPLGPIFCGITRARSLCGLLLSCELSSFTYPQKGGPKSFMNKSKKRAPFKKERSSETVSTRLWEADHALFSETVGRRRTTPAELLRQIVHEWAITMRLSGQNSDEPETAAPIRKLDEQILAEQLAPINQTLAAISQRLNVPLLEIANTQDGADPASDTDSVLMAQMRRVTEDMETVLENLSRLRMFTIAHYNLSAQTYAGNWALLDFVRGDLVEPRLQTDPEYKDDASNTALAEGKVNWNEALAMVKELASYFNTPELYCYLIPWRFKAANGSGRYESDENEALSNGANQL